MSYARPPLRIKPLFLLSVLIVLALLPIWSVRYFAPHDYYQHLLEAQVVAHYDDPEFAYQAYYQIRDGWYAQSNALSTLLMIGLGQVMPIEIAGKLALSLYVVVFAVGMFWLLRFLNRPVWLLLLLPLLIYNVTFTSGWLNWSYGVALIPLAVLCYLYWQQGRRWMLPLLAVLMLLIYLAHGFAWGMCLIILCTLAVIDHLPIERYLRLSLAISSAAPVLLIARPLLACAPVALAGALWLLAALVRRQRFRRTTLVLLGVVVDICYVGAVIVFYKAQFFRATRDEMIPYVGYLLGPKLIAPIQLFTLPHYEVPIQWVLVGANIMLLVLLACIGGWLISSSIAEYRARGLADWRWLGVFGVLVFCYPLMPSYTPDIEAIEPRLLLLICVFGLCWVRLPPPNSRSHHILIGLLVAIGLFSSIATLSYAQRYDSLAQRWARTLDEMQPVSRVLVLGHASLPIPHGTWYRLARTSRPLNQSPFVTTYAIERGGFVTNTLWNGPLSPHDTTILRSSWYDKKDPGTSIAEQCSFIRETYTYVVGWDISNRDLLQALQDCYGRPMAQETRISIWRP